MEKLIEYLPILIPFIILQFTLGIIALVHVLKHPNYKFGKKAFWIPFVLFVNTIGPIVYFIFGRNES